MKNLFICLGFLVSVSAFAGGVSGGGGNSKPANPVTQNEVHEMARQARMYVMFYFNYLERMRQWDKSPLTDKLFNGPVTINQKILEVPVTLNDSGPCLDPDGNEMDGSAIATGEQSICISVPRLAAKLSKENLRNQTFALVAHEYSHLVGTTEAEADEIQGKAIDRFIYADYHTVTEEFRRLVNFQNFDITFLKAVPANLDRMAWKDLAELIDGTVYRKITEGFQSGRDFTLFPEFMREAALTVNARYELLNNGVCELEGGMLALECGKVLDMIFQRDSEINYPKYLARKGWHDDAKQYPHVLYRRVTDKETARIEVERLLADLAVLENYIITLRGY